jgi:dTDP-4-amino-4,6-dideoxygalactose transaminase
MALDLREGDAAIVPAITFLATANAVRMTGAEVVFADVDPETGLMTAETFEAAVERGGAGGRRIRAAVPVHLGGQVCDMARIGAIAKARDIELIEDACHALGVPGIAATRQSAATCFSTHPVKAITTGEGGLVATGDAGRADRMRRLRNHGMSRDAADFKNRSRAMDGDQPYPWYYEMAEVGWNYRIPDVLCALGISQLEKLQRFWRRRCEIAALYDRLLAPLAPRLRPVPRQGTHGWHLYAVLVDFESIGISRRQLMELLREEGIWTQVHYIPVHQQPYYRARYGDLPLPGAEAYYARCLSIPIFPAMAEDDVEWVAAALTRHVRRAGA